MFSSPLAHLWERLQPPFSPELNTMNLLALTPSPACGGGLGRGRWHDNEFVAAHTPSPPAPLPQVGEGRKTGGLNLLNIMANQVAECGMGGGFQSAFSNLKFL